MKGLLGLLAGAGVGRWLALALAAGAGVGGYWLGHRVAATGTERVMRLWAEDRAQRAEADLTEYETAAALEARVRKEVMDGLATKQIDIDRLADGVRALGANVRLCAMSYQKSAAAPPAAGGADAAGGGGQLEPAVGVLQALAANLAERCDREAVRANALREWIDGVAPP